MSSDASALIDSVVGRYDNDLLELRRDLHAHPELSWREVRTTARVSSRLEAAGWRVTPQPRTSIVADPGDSGARVALRAHLDAPAVVDLTADPWPRPHAGGDHACGPDMG